MELKKILIEKMEGNTSIQRSDEQRNLYKALVDAYKADKTILDSYEETAILKRRRKDDDDQEGPSTGSDRGSKRRREGGEPESASTLSEPATRSACRSTTRSQSRQMSANESAFAEEPVPTTCHIDEPSYPKPQTPDSDWNKTLPANQGRTQTWISEPAKQADSRSSFNDLLDTPLDFSNFIMNRLRVHTLTTELLAGPTYELMKGSCNSLIELKYHLEELYKETTDQLDWVNPEGQQYLHNLLQPLLLIPNNRGHRVIPFAYFINNDLEYLRGDASSQKYTTSVTKTKAADYEHIKWIEDLVPCTMWIQEPINYDKRIIAITSLKIVEWHNYKHLDWILIRRDDDKDVYTEYRHLATCERSSTGSQKLPEEAQPYQARHVPIRSEATRSIYCLFVGNKMHKAFPLLFQIQQYLQHEHYALWEVIEFDDSYKVPTTTDPNNTTTRKDDERSGRTATKKRKKNLLKQQYGNFKAEGSENLEQTFNRLQVIVSQLQFMDVEIEKDDLNQKFLTSLAPEWLMHTILWRNRNDLDTMSLDDLYNHLKVYEAEVQKKSNLNSQNMAFISSSKHNSGDEDGNTACVSTSSTTFPTASASIDEDDIEEMDIKWSMALLSMRADKFWKRTRKKISIQGSDVAGFDKSKVECFNCHKMGHFVRECMAPRS
nr:hypothetical protein [Tanacetum cinerariifolium]